MSSSRRSLNFAIGMVLGIAVSLGSLDASAADKSKHEASITAAEDALEQYTENDPDLNDHLQNAAGYVVFPEIGKAGVVVGGGGGDGILFEKGVPVGKAKVTFVNVGAQIGGQRFSEVIIFRDKAALKDFKRGRGEFLAGASAVAAGAGASASLNYKNGVAVMTKTSGGLMAEAVIGGQKFTYMAFTKPEPRT